ncbi:2'-5' RNA ligase family protein [Pseudonocardia adelaidensis]|uniref:2'-5' RNA ligase family protein n=1 Tax=Pseudonocardia adelaidensis TaxID=648754 RepID=A0ABP9NQZ7_9PSEU
MESTLSAVVVPVPEAEPRVGVLRAALDPSATLGVPAHVTIMFPFVPPARLDDAVVAALGEVLAAVPAFEVEFSKVSWFSDVVWWAPEPAEPFVALTHAVAARFGLEPYEGAYGDAVVPHLTIGHGAPMDRMRAAEAEVAAGPPLRASVRTASLMTGSRAAGSWTTVAELPLGGG